LASLAWAFAKVAVPAPELFAAIGKEASCRMSELAAQDVGTLAWAFATLGVRDPELFAAIGARAQATEDGLDMDGFSEQVRSVGLAPFWLGLAPFWPAAMLLGACACGVCCMVALVACVVCAACRSLCVVRNVFLQP
jgi:hypothetical protein